MSQGRRRGPTRLAEVPLLEGSESKTTVAFRHKVS